MWGDAGRRGHLLAGQPAEAEVGALRRRAIEIVGRAGVGVGLEALEGAREAKGGRVQVEPPALECKEEGAAR